MHRRAFLLATLAAALSARAQPAKGLRRVGYLSMTSPERDLAWVGLLREGLKNLGYIEGQNLILEQRHAQNDAAMAVELAADLVRHEVEVMVIYGSSAMPALKKKFTGLPLVFLAHADPVGSGLVVSLARPGGNITGLTDGHADLAPKRLELLKDLVPSTARVAVLFNPRTHATRQWQLLQAAAPGLGVTIVPMEIKSPKEIERAFEEMQAQRADAVVLAPDPSWSAGQERRTSDAAKRHRLPAIGSISEFADQGLLLAYGTNFGQLWRRSAVYVDKLLRGSKAADLAIEHPTRFDLVINLRTAAMLGIKVPRAFIMRAERVID
jgi:putative ABC transport system substrate-binding protein